MTSAFIINYSFALFYFSYFQFYWGIIPRHLPMKKNHSSQGCWSPSWGQWPTFGVSFQSFLHSYFLSTSQHPQHLIQLTNRVQRLVFPNCCFYTLSWRLTFRNKRLFHIYQQLIAITVALWPHKGLHLQGSVIVSCCVVELGDHHLFPPFNSQRC